MALLGRVISSLISVLIRPLFQIAIGNKTDTAILLQKLKETKTSCSRIQQFGDLKFVLDEVCDCEFS